MTSKIEKVQVRIKDHIIICKWSETRIKVIILLDISKNLLFVKLSEK